MVATWRRPRSTDTFAIQPQNFEFSTTNHIAAYSSAHNNNNKGKSHDEQIRNRTLGAMLPPLPPGVTSSSTNAVQSYVESRRASSDVLLPSLTSHSCTGAAFERLSIGRCVHNRPPELCRLCDYKLTGTCIFLSDNTPATSHNLFTVGWLSAPGTSPSDPPVKKLCRQMSITMSPADASDDVSRWQPRASSVWHPIAHRTHNKHFKHRHPSCQPRH